MVSDVQSEEDRKIPVERYKLDMPVLFIACEGDAVNPKETIEPPRQAGLLPDLKVVKLQSGHWCTYEKPGELAKFIVDFLEDRKLLS